MEISYLDEKKKILMNKSENKDLFYKLKCNLNLLKGFIEESIEKKNLYVSFNGGKDCTATLLVLKYYFFCSLKNINYNDESSFNDFIDNQYKEPINNDNIKLVYFIKSDVYQEEIDFCFYIAKKEKVKLLLIQSNYKSGLQFLKNATILETIFMGIRIDDYPSDKPISDRDIIQHSDSNYPSFYRLYPVYQFTYREIWMLILQSKYDYLNLYNYGYTSIGSKSKTLKNEELELHVFYNKNKDKMTESDKSKIFSLLTNLSSETDLYLAAYHLDDFETERCYRN